MSIQISAEKDSVQLEVDMRAKAIMVDMPNTELALLMLTEQWTETHNKVVSINCDKENMIRFLKLSLSMLENEEGE